MMTGYIVEKDRGGGKKSKRLRFMKRKMEEQGREGEEGRSNISKWTSLWKKEEHFIIMIY